MMPSLSRRRFSQLVVTAPFALLAANAAQANLIDHLDGRYRAASQR